jgi:hypothetical protein
MLPRWFEILLMIIACAASVFLTVALYLICIALLIFTLFWQAAIAFSLACLFLLSALGLIEDLFAKVDAREQL